MLCTAALDTRPVIGILTQPTEPGKFAMRNKHTFIAHHDETNDSRTVLQPYGSSYLASSYVEFVEAGGARAVAVHHNASISELEHYYENLNGILFPGNKYC